MVNVQPGFHNATLALHNPNVLDLQWTEFVMFEVSHNGGHVDAGPAMIYITSPSCFSLVKEGHLQVTWEVVRSDSLAMCRVYVNSVFQSEVACHQGSSGAVVPPGQHQVNVTVAIAIDQIEVARDSSLLIVTKDTSAAGSIITNTDALLDPSPSKSPKDIGLFLPPRAALFMCTRQGAMPIQATSRDVNEADPLFIAVDGNDYGSTTVLSAFLPISQLSEGHHTLELSRRSPPPRSIRMSLNRTSFTLMYLPSDDDIPPPPPHSFPQHGCRTFLSARDHDKTFNEKPLPSYAAYAAAERSIYSEGGEDGVLLQLFNDIGHASKLFIETGAGDGSHASSRDLRVSSGWAGMHLDAAHDSPDDGFIATDMGSFDGFGDFLKAQVRGRGLGFAI